MKNIIFLMCFSFALGACSSDQTSGGAEIAGTNVGSIQSSVENTPVSSDSRVESSSANSYGVVPYDTTKNYGSPNANAVVDGSVTSSSKVEYNFRTQGTILYEAFDVPSSLIVSVYYSELGARIGVADDDISNAIIYRILPAGDSKFVGWMWNAAYYHIKNCDRDLGLFVEKCNSLLGEFQNYIDENSCDTRHRLELSCVFPQKSELSDKDYLDSVAMAEKDFAEKYWNVPVKPIED